MPGCASSPRPAGRSPVRIAGEDRWIAIEDAGRYRDGVGASPPSGVPEAFLVRVDGALESLLARFARSHGPFLAHGAGARAGACRWASSRMRSAAWRVRARSSAASSGPTGSEREWCDPEVLRQLRRRSLARLRREVEPVDPETLGRFLPAWQGVIPIGSNASRALRGSAALERLAEVVDQLSGVPIPASVLERDVLPARVAGYQPRLLDELGALGEVAWVGHGSLGRDDGRVVLHRPGRELLLPASAGDGTPPPDAPLHRAIRDHLATRGASFFRAIQAAPAAPAGRRPTEREVLDALWDLVWAGEVTNDTFAPLRALRWKRPHGLARGLDARPRARPADRARAAGGGGSLVARRSGVWDPAPTALSPTERLHQLALALLDRHGVLVRESVMAEGTEGGFSGVYPMLRALEESGRIRRGYFVEGLGAAQFALAGALERLRAVREPASTTGDAPVVHLLAAADPANPYGAAVPWPRRGETDRRPLQRAAGRIGRARRRRRRAVPGPRRLVAPDPARVRRSGDRDGGPRFAAARCWRSRAVASWSFRASTASRLAARRGTKHSCGPVSSRAIAESSCEKSAHRR